MENEEIAARLADQETSSQDEKVTEQVFKKLLVFDVAGTRYAMYAEEVREIVTESEIYYIPFVPPYVRGLLNRHGAPYTVFDFQVIVNNEKLQADKYLILKMENDQVAFIVTDVVGIMKIEQSRLLSISGQQGIENMFSGAFDFENEKIFIIKNSSILERLANDLQSG